MQEPSFLDELLDPLTGEERAEYESLVNAADLIAILELKAQRRLAA